MVLNLIYCHLNSYFVVPLGVHRHLAGLQFLTSNTIKSTLQVTILAIIILGFSLPLMPLFWRLNYMQLVYITWGVYGDLLAIVRIWKEVILTIFFFENKIKTLVNRCMRQKLLKKNNSFLIAVSFGLNTLRSNFVSPPRNQRFFEPRSHHWSQILPQQATTLSWERINIRHKLISEVDFPLRFDLYPWPKLTPCKGVATLRQGGAFVPPGPGTHPCW